MLYTGGGSPTFRPHTKHMPGTATHALVIKPTTVSTFCHKSAELVAIFSSIVHPQNRDLAVQVKQLSSDDH